MVYSVIREAEDDRPYRRSRYFLSVSESSYEKPRMDTSASMYRWLSLPSLPFLELTLMYVRLVRIAIIERGCDKLTR